MDTPTKNTMDPARLKTQVFNVISPTLKPGLLKIQGEKPFESIVANGENAGYQLNSMFSFSHVFYLIKEKKLSYLKYHMELLEFGLV